MRTSRLFFAVWIACSAGAALAAPGQMSFTPVSLKVPIRSISITGFESVSGTNTPLPGVDPDAGTMSEVYSCAAADEADCLIDLADDSQMAARAAAGSSSINVGQYGGGTFSLCPNTGGAGNNVTPSHILYVKGQATLAGTTYYTTSESNGALTTDASKYDYTPVSITTCQASFRFSSVLTVKKDEPVTLTLFSLIRDTAWMDLSVKTDTSVGANCGGGTGGGVCLNYPAIVPYVGTTSAVVEAYEVFPAGRSSDASFGELLICFSQAGVGFGGTSFPKVAPATVAGQSGGFGQLFSSLKANSDGTFDLETFGSSPATDEVGYLSVPNFSRQSSVGAIGSLSYRTCSTGKAADQATQSASYSRVQ